MRPTAALSRRVMRGVDLMPEGVVLALARSISESTAVGSAGIGLPGAPVVTDAARTYERGHADGYAARSREMDADWQRECDRARASAAEAGRREGHAAGAEEARVAAETRLLAESESRELEVRECLRRLQQVTETLADSFHQVLDSAEDELVCLCHDIVARILGTQLVSATAIHALIRQVRETRKGAPPFTVAYLNPDDHAHLAGLPELQGVGVEWRADATVDCGGVVLCHDHGSVDARFEVQMRAVQELLRSERSARRGAMRGDS